MRSVRVSRDAAKVVARADATLRKRLRDRIAELAKAPTERAEPLKGTPDLWRTRVGGWRIVYRFDADTLFVDVIATRGQVYRDL